MAKPSASRNGRGRDNDDPKQSVTMPPGLTFITLVRCSTQRRPNYHGPTRALPLIALQPAACRSGRGLVRAGPPRCPLACGHGAVGVRVCPGGGTSEVLGMGERLGQ